MNARGPSHCSFVLFPSLGFGFWVLVIRAFSLAAVLITSSCSRTQSANEVVVYATQDQQFAEPILADFQKQTGIKVRAVYDSEAVKTVALANRLLAEASHPRSDVWWSNEALRTRQLAARGVFETNLIAEFGFRSRRIVINTNRLALASAPKSLVELTNAQWRGKVALAYPMFGTTSAQFVALRRHWGAAAWEQWCRALAANQPFLVDGNSVVVRLVGRGEAVIGLTDFDDVAAGQREGLPIAALPMNAETLLIPNTVGVVRGAPHGTQAARLYEYLRSEAVASRLVELKALEGVQSDGSGLPMDWHTAHEELNAAVETMRRFFLR
jgi:iron(III) transport system substrate-binding protein